MNKIQTTLIKSTGASALVRAFLAQLGYSSSGVSWCGGAGGWIAGRLIRGHWGIGGSRTVGRRCRWHGSRQQGQQLGPASPGILPFARGQFQRPVHRQACIEHHAVLHTCQYLEKDGFEVEYIPVDEYGTINLKALAEAIDGKTALISVMYANNEVGTIQPAAEIGRLAKAAGVPVYKLLGGKVRDEVRVGAL